MGIDTTGGRLAYFWIGLFQTFNYGRAQWQWLSPYNVNTVKMVLPVFR